MSEMRRKFDPEFCEGAVWIVREAGKPIAQIARDLGVNSGTLGNWVDKDRVAEGTAMVRLPRTARPNSSGSVLRSPSSGWSAMSSCDRWSCG